MPRRYPGGVPRALVHDLTVARDAGARDHLVVEVDCSSPPSRAISSSSDWTLRAYSCEAWSGIVAGRLSGATIVTSSRDDRLARLGELAVAARLRRPGR